MSVCTGLGVVAGLQYGVDGAAMVGKLALSVSLCCLPGSWPQLVQGLPAPLNSVLNGSSEVPAVGSVVAAGANLSLPDRLPS